MIKRKPDQDIVCAQLMIGMSGNGFSKCLKIFPSPPNALISFNKRNKVNIRIMENAIQKITPFKADVLSPTMQHTMDTTISGKAIWLYFAYVNVYDHKLTSAALMQVDASSSLDVPKMGDDSVAFMRGPILNVGGNITEIQFIKGNVQVNVLGQNLVNLNDVSVGTISPMAQAIDQAIPAAGLPRQTDCVSQ